MIALSILEKVSLAVFQWDKISKTLRQAHTIATQSIDIAQFTMKILVRNLARTTTEEAVRTLFAGFGHVASVTIVMDPATKQSKGFGFVEMPNPKHAVTAVKRSNLTRFEGSVIRVKLSEDKPAENKPAEDDATEA